MNELAVISVCDLEKILETKMDQALSKALGSVKPSEALPSKLFNQKELCNYLNISEPTIISLKKKGKIPFLLIGSSVRFDPMKVIAAFEKKTK